LSEPTGSTRDAHTARAGARARLRAWSAGAQRPLRVPGFRQVAAGYTINELGNWLGDIALAVLVFDRTHSALATAALFLCAGFLPALCAPVLTARLERLEGARVLPALHLAEAIVFGVLAFTAGTVGVVVLVALAAVDGVMAITARALMWATTAALLRPHDLLREGNSLLNGGFTVAGAVGPILGGVLVAALGFGPALGLDAASFAVAAGLLAAARMLPLGAANEERWGGRLREGVRYGLRTRRVRALLGGQAVALVLFTLVVPIEVVFVKGQLHAGNAGYGALLTAWGAGMIAGAATFSLARRTGTIWLLGISALAIGIGYLGIAASPTLLVACLFSLLGGIGNGIEWVALLTALQAETTPERQAVVMSLFEALGTVMPGLGFALGGVIATAWSPRTAYAVSGAGVIVLVAIGAVAARRFHEHRPAAPPAFESEIAT
jgi:MFS family permease